MASAVEAPAMRRISARVLFSLVAPLAIGALAPPARAQERTTLTLSGSVKDPVGRPIAQAEVVVVGTDRVARTTDAGTFRLDSVPPGRRWVAVRRLGFEPARYALTLERAQDRSLAVELSPLPQSLPPMVVEARSGFSGRYADFYRRQRSQWGYFITHDDLARERPARLGWMVQRYLPFTDPQSMDEPPFLGPYGFGAWPAASRGLGRASYNRLCPPAVSVNGAPPSAGWAVNDFYPGDVEAVEVYRGDYSRVPIEYSSYPGTGCGLVVVWLK